MNLLLAVFLVICVSFIGAFTNISQLQNATSSIGAIESTASSPLTTTTTTTTTRSAETTQSLNAVNTSSSVFVLSTTFALTLTTAGLTQATTAAEENFEVYLVEPKLTLNGSEATITIQGTGFDSRLLVRVGGRGCNITELTDLQALCKTEMISGSNLDVQITQGTREKTFKNAVSFVGGSVQILCTLASEVGDVTIGVLAAFRTMMFIVLQLVEQSQVFILGVDADSTSEENHDLAIIRWRLLNSGSQPNASVDKIRLLIQYVDDGTLADYGFGITTLQVAASTPLALKGVPLPPQPATPRVENWQIVIIVIFGVWAAGTGAYVFVQLRGHIRRDGQAAGGRASEGGTEGDQGDTRSDTNDTASHTSTSKGSRGTTLRKK